MKYLYYYCFLIFLSSCASQKQEKKDHLASDFAVEQDHSEAKWITAFNDGGSLDSLYINEAVIVNEKGIVYGDQEEKKAFFKDFKATIGNIETIKIDFNTTTVKNIRYKAGAFTTSNKHYYKYLSIEEANEQRALDFFAKADMGTGVDLAEINEARSAWMRLCNQHNAYELVQQYYTKNAIYYNHKPVLVGTDNIAKEYDYMNNPNYNLTLTPLFVEPVNRNLVFEIGQCSGSYGGKYLLVWEKGEDGVWRVLLDSNV